MQKLTTFLWFDKEAREAANFYKSVFKENCKIKDEQKMNDTPSGNVEIINLEIFNQEFSLMSAGPFEKFNASISFVINCENQEEVDYYWQNLSADPKSEQCGWLKDKFGLSWQVVPKQLNEILSGNDQEGVKRATQAMLKMKKLNIDELQKAYNQK